MTVNEFIKNYKSATDKEVLSAISVSNFIAVSVAIFETVRRNLDGREYLDAIKRVENREDYFWKPYRVGDIATAAYHVLSGEPYKGNNTEVLYLIKNGMPNESVIKAS